MTRLFMVFTLAVMVVASAACADELPLAEPWQAAYEGDDARGTHVLGLWNFEPGEETADSSGRKRSAKWDGASLEPKGRFGGALRSAPGWPKSNQPHRLLVANDADLSPKGAFTVELWICPEKELTADYGESFLIDKKYVAHDDYQLILSAAEKSGSRTLRAVLGFGSDSETWNSRPFQLPVGQWRHVAFTYDGAGTGRFFVDGVPHGHATFSGRKGISPGKHGLSIGDRIGSNYHGFPGLIDQVRLTARAAEFSAIKFERVSDRTCFRRMEPDAAIRLAVTNLLRRPLPDSVLSVSGPSIPRWTKSLGPLDSGRTETIVYPIDSRLRPDVYELLVELTPAGETNSLASDRLTVRIVPRPLPARFPVLMWGVYDGVPRELERLKQLGFTHVLGLSADYGRIWEAGKPTEAASPQKVAEAKAMLDQCLAHDLTIVASLSPGQWLRSKPEMLRVDRQGKTLPGKSDICGLIPEIETYCYNVGASVAQTYGAFPAFGAALIHTEVRDHAQPCFHAHDIEAFRKSAGIDVPAEIAGRTGVHYRKLNDFPASRVVPDNFPILAYMRWYWKEGDGWNGLNTALHRGLKSTGRQDLWTFHDPAVRVARVYGAGGEVDVLSQWTYSYPDPIRIGLATDELLATAAGRPGQEVMKMTQIIWYRSQTAPIPKPDQPPPAFEARWEMEQPDAQFITIAPMHLREAFWTKIARPIKGIMYHGWQSLVPVEKVASYRLTHPQTASELSRLTREVVGPLGPMLLNVPGVRSDVAVLQSFASEMLAGRGTYGWGRGWAGDAYHVFQYAHLQPEILLDETIVEKGLDGYRVLGMFDCDVLTQSVVDRVKKFQSNGGIVIGDENLCPAIKPDIVLPVYARTGRNDADRAALVEAAGKLRTQLDARYSRFVDTTSPDVIPYRRRAAGADYLFVVNDRREYGSYVGHHGLVMENGLPSRATVRVARQAAAVYDLVDSRRVFARVDAGATVFDVELGPCDGRVFLVCDQAIAGVRIAAAEEATRGGWLACEISVVDGNGKSLSAVVPLKIAIRDPDGRPAEFSGYDAAIDGKRSLTIDIAPNDLPGLWQIEVRELASNQTATHYFRVAGPTPWPPAKKPIPKELVDPVQPKG